MTVHFTVEALFYALATVAFVIGAAITRPKAAATAFWVCVGLALVAFALFLASLGIT